MTAQCCHHQVSLEIVVSLSDHFHLRQCRELCDHKWVSLPSVMSRGTVVSYMPVTTTDASPLLSLVTIPVPFLLFYAFMGEIFSKMLVGPEFRGFSFENGSC